MESKMIRTELLACAGVALLAGWLGLLVPGVAHLSYDVPLLFLGRAQHPEVVLIYLNEAELESLGREPDGTLHRRRHAELIAKLSGEQPRLLFYDFLFARTNRDASVDRELAAAISNAPALVLISALQSSGVPGGGEVVERIDPHPAFGARHSGVSYLDDPVRGVRRLLTRVGDDSTAVWEAAQLQPGGAKLYRDTERWIRYPGSRPGFKERSFAEILTNAAVRAACRDKYVFLGSKFAAGALGQPRDVFPTPYSWHRFEKEAPGLELQAVSFLNLIEGRWLTRVPTALQVLLLIVLIVSLAWLMFDRFPRHIVLIAFAALLLVTVGGIVLPLFLDVWWNWLAAVFFAIPAVSGWCLCRNWRKPNPVAFLSYRRREGHGTAYAQALAASLRERGYDAFLDVKDIEAGEEFKDRIEKEMIRRPHVIIIISAGALERLLAPKPGERDFYQLEIETAFDLKDKAPGRSVIPIRIWDEQFDRARVAELPPKVRRLFELHWIEHEPGKPLRTVEELLKSLG